MLMGDKTRIKIRSNDPKYNFPTNYFLVLGYEKKILKIYLDWEYEVLKFTIVVRLLKRLYSMHMALWLMLFFLIFFSTFEERSLQICLKEGKISTLLGIDGGR